MWAQLIKMRVKPGREGDLPGLFDELQTAEQPDSGLLRTMGMQDQKDPGWAYVLVVFESEEKARAREQDPRRAEALSSAQAMMGDLFDGAPEFTDLTVIRDVSP
jgi:hypothetical protein